MGFTAEWNGGMRTGGHHPHPRPPLSRTSTTSPKSHFSHGVLTFHPGYLFRTPPGWSMWAMGPPNHVKDGIQPLVGLVETDWLPFPFTMNWIFTRPGQGALRSKGEPFCFITLAQDKPLESFERGAAARWSPTRRCSASTRPGASSATSSTSALFRASPRR